MKVLITGAAGQLGQALLASKPQKLGSEPLQVLATSRLGGNEQVALDLSDRKACRDLVAEFQPDWVLNAGAYTAVDRAETEPALAKAVNADAPRVFAEVLLKKGGRLLQISTDFVFSGKQWNPYQPDQVREPLGVYASTKAEAESIVETLLIPSNQGLILRTSWVYGPIGRNFLLTMLGLHRHRSETGEPLRVVADQVGCPTATVGLSTACWKLIERSSDPKIHSSLPSILHWSDSGVASWYDFAVAIGELAVDHGLLPRAAFVEPIRTEDFPTPAERPSFSLLDCQITRQALDLPGTHWRRALSDVIAHFEK